MLKHISIMADLLAIGVHACFLGPTSPTINYHIQARLLILQELDSSSAISIT